MKFLGIVSRDTKTSGFKGDFDSIAAVQVGNCLDSGSPVPAYINSSSQPAHRLVCNNFVPL